MRKRLPTRTLLFMAAMYGALTLGSAAAAQAAPMHKQALPNLAANPGVVDGTPRADQTLLRAGRRHSCQSIHLSFEAGGQAQSAALILKREGRPDVTVSTVSDSTGTLDAALRPGRAWSIVGSTPSVSIAVYAKGWASCRSAKGLR